MKTLTIMKPDGFKKKLVGECLKRFEAAGLNIEYLEVTRLKKEQVRKFYSHLAKKYGTRLVNAIVSYMCSGKVALAVLSGKNAVEKVREIVGKTNPAEAEKGTIRNDFSEDDLRLREVKFQATRNIIHASGSPAEARKEIAFFIRKGL